MLSKSNYTKMFISSLNLDENNFSEEIQYNEVDEWDSIGHMTLISALEEEYKITFETDDIIDFSSFKKGIEILKKYQIDIK